LAWPVPTSRPSSPNLFGVCRTRIYREVQRQANSVAG
jgi:hypothetical protein